MYTTTPVADKAKSTKAVKAPRNRSVQARGLGRTPMGASSTVTSIMKRVGSTNAPTIVITAKKDLYLTAETIDTRTGESLAETSIHLPADFTLVLVQSSFPGLYYVGCAMHSKATCTCGHYQNRYTCKHQEPIMAAHQAHARRQTAREFVRAVGQLEDKQESSLDQNVTSSDEVVSAGFKFDVVEGSYAEQLQTATSIEERREIWKRVQEDTRIRDKAAAAAYWAKVHEVRAQASV